MAANINETMMSGRLQKQNRSASISGTSSSMENTINTISMGSKSSTPITAKRQRPATRSQSARISATSAKYMRKRSQQHQQQQLVDLQEFRSHYTSEPKLNETETPPQPRKLSQRKPPQHGQGRIKVGGFLDVPYGNMQQLRLSDDEDLDRLRTFSASKGGIINRGDSFRRRRSRSNSLAAASPTHAAVPGYMDGDIDSYPDTQQHVDVYRVEMLGSSGVGKQALLSQFRTSDCINAYDGQDCEDAEQNISIILNGIESELKFYINKNLEKEELAMAAAYIVVYSCIDKESFTRSKQILARLQDMDLLRTRPAILVANKIDLARSRSVSTQDGKCLACTFGAKFIEVSVGINHNCDELLAGVLAQIRLKKEQNLLEDNDEASSAQQVHWYKSRGVVLASMKARQMLTWILGKEDTKFKHCENLQIL